jgi:hypothetical protein
MPLIKEGKDYLYNAAINGSFGGPAKGGNLKLSDADTRLAVDYMVDQAKSRLRWPMVAQAGRGKISLTPTIKNAALCRVFYLPASPSMPKGDAGHLL